MYEGSDLLTVFTEPFYVILFNGSSSLWFSYHAVSNRARDQQRWLIIIRKKCSSSIGIRTRILRKNF